MTVAVRRALIGLVNPLLAAVIVVGAFVAWSDRLPDPMASHWDFSGEPDDSVSRPLFTALMIAVTLVLGLATTWVSRRRDPGPMELSVPLAVATFLQWTLALITLTAVVANLDAATWRDADELPILLALATGAAAAVIAAGVAAIARTLEQPAEAADEELATIELGPDEMAMWMGHMRVHWPLLLGSALSLMGIAFIFAVDLWPGLIFIASSTVVMALASVTVTADRRGLVVGYGPFRWPKTRIPLDRIRRASVIDVARGSHGGWGYRGSLKVLGKAAVVLRSGEAVLLELDDGKQFVVTVDGARSAAGALNDLVARQSGARGAATGRR